MLKINIKAIFFGFLFLLFTLSLFSDSEVWRLKMSIGDNYFNNQIYDKALQEYEEAYKLNKNYEIISRMYNLFIFTKNMEKLKNYLEEWKDIIPANIIDNWYINYFLILGKNKDAKNYFDNSLKKFTKKDNIFANYCYQIAYAFFNYRYYEDAESILNLAVKEYKEEPYFYYLYIMIYESLEKYDKAIEYYFKDIKSRNYSDYDKENFIRKIESYTDNSNYKEFLEILEKNKSLVDDRTYKTLKINIYYKIKKYDKIVEIIDEFSKDNKNFSLVKDIIEKLIYINEYQYVNEIINKILLSFNLKDEEKYELVLYLSEIYTKQNKPEKAKEVLINYYNTTNNIALKDRMCLSIADYFYNEKNYSKSIEFYKNYLERNSRHMDIYYKLFDSYVLTDSLEKAENILSKISSLVVKNEVVLYLQGELKMLKGNLKEAKDKFTEIIFSNDINSEYGVKALTNIMTIDKLLSADSINVKNYLKLKKLYKLQDYAEAEKMINSLESYGKYKPEDLFLKLFALIRIDAGNLEEAEKLLQRYNRKYFKNSDIDEVLFILAGVYEKMNSKEKAIEIYKQIIINYSFTYYGDIAKKKLRGLVN